ncbi:MAG: hypothetical protein GY864_10430 [Desulfobacterales bacterium]|nr:hypothetical protein [Desulfobacterales bacterium]
MLFSTHLKTEAGNIPAFLPEQMLLDPDAKNDPTIAPISRETTRSENTGRPDRTRFTAKLGFGIPGLVQGGMEVFVNDHFTAEAGIGKAPLNMVYTAIVRWRPEATCWKCEAEKQYHLAFGLEANFLPEGDLWKRAMFIAGPDIDFHYQRKLKKNRAWVLGLRIVWGFGYKFNPPWKEEGYIARAEDTGELVAQDESEFYPFIPAFNVYTGIKY